MTAYLLLVILAVGIPFLLYCLWNFSREFRPRTSRAVLSSRASHRVALSAIPLSRFRGQAPAFSRDTKVTRQLNPEGA
jgi:hypothetical protein